MKDSELIIRETAQKCSANQRLLTYDDYRKTPPGQRFELVEGVLRRMDAPTILHQDVLQRLWLQLYGQLQARGKGRVYHAAVDVLLSDHNVVQPDLLYVKADRLGIIGQANVSGAPDLVVEILSPTTERWDRQVKRQLYERYGVREYWIVDTGSQTVEVMSLEDKPMKRPEMVTVGVFRAGSTIESPLLPEVVIEVTGLFRD